MPRYAQRNAHIGKAAMVPEVHCVDIELVLDRLEECRIILFSIARWKDASGTPYVSSRKRLRICGW
jgi:hypothetical protein